MKKIESLQALRAIAFIAIFLSHCNVISTGPMGVSIFLVLSGFLLTLSAKRRKESLPVGLVENIRFAFSKMKKLYSLHILTLLAMILFMLKSSDKSDYWISKAAINALLIQAWVPLKDWYLTFNKASWYLSVCAFAYFIFPWLYSKIQGKDKNGLILVWGGTAVVFVSISILLCLVESYIDSDLTKWFTYIFPVYRCWDMFMGMFLGKLYCWTVDDKPHNRVFTLLEAVLFVLWGVQIYLYRKGYLIPNAFRFSIYWMPTSLLAVYIFAKKGGLITKLLTNRFVVFVGNVSGIAFLVHQIIIGVAEMVFKNTWIITIVAFSVTLIASYVYKSAEMRIRGFVNAHRNA